MSLSFESEPHQVKKVVREALDAEPDAKKKCTDYAAANGYENLDFLLEKMIYEGGFGALVIIDELSEDLEAILVRQFKFPVEVITLSRYASEAGERIYQFEPFLADVTAPRRTSRGQRSTVGCPRGYR